MWCDYQQSLDAGSQTRMTTAMTHCVKDFDDCDADGGDVSFGAGVEMIRSKT